MEKGIKVVLKVGIAAKMTNVMKVTIYRVATFKPVFRKHLQMTDLKETINYTALCMP